MHVQGIVISTVHVPEFKHVYTGLNSFYATWPDTDMLAGAASGGAVMRRQDVPENRAYLIGLGHDVG